MQTQSRKYSSTQSESFATHGDKIPAARQRVLDAFVTAEDRLTRDDIAYLTKLRLSRVCGRGRELMQDGMLVDRGRRFSEDTGKTQQLVGLPVVRS